MASEFKQITCNARNLAATLNDLIDNLEDGQTISDPIIFLHLEHNDDILICYYFNESAEDLEGLG